MAKKSEIKVVCRRPKALMVIVVAAVILLSIAALTVLQSAIASTRAETDALRPQANALEQENSRLQQYIEELGTIQGIIRIAKEKLGLIEPDSIIFDTETVD